MNYYFDTFNLMDRFRTMTPREFLNSHNEDHCEKIAGMAGTNLANLKLIALYDGSCSPRLAKSLAEASGNKMTRDEILFPEIYENNPA